jgi:hypothetical protein
MEESRMAAPPTLTLDTNVNFLANDPMIRFILLIVYETAQT